MALFLPDILIFFIGLCIGSFLNVCIYRLPRENISVNHPKRSMCPQCSTQLHYWENIPLISYVFLMGKCRTCKSPIPIRYPVVELISAFFALATSLKYGWTFSGLIYYMLLSSLVVITFVDLDYQIIPNIISLPGIVLGFLASFFLPEISYTDSLMGILVGGGLFYSIAYIFMVIRGIEGMGMGDMKLLAMLGAFLGLKGVVFIIFISSVLGTITGIMVMVHTRSFSFKLKIPYGPFLSIAAMVYIFWGKFLIFHYVMWLKGY
jgi:leader peptidase (prepilin peptidase)/N-methyltransferase